MALHVPADRPNYRSPGSYILAGNVTIPHVFEWNAKVNPNHPLFRYHDGYRIREITFAQAILGIRRAARYVNALVGTQPTCIAIVTNTGVTILRLPCKLS